MTPVPRALALAAGLAALGLACAGLLAAWLSPGIVLAWAALAAMCG